MGYWKPYTKTAAIKKIVAVADKSCPMPVKATKEDALTVLAQRVSLVELAVASLQEELEQEGGGKMHLIIRRLTSH